MGVERRQLSTCSLLQTGFPSSTGVLDIGFSVMMPFVNPTATAYTIIRGTQDSSIAKLPLRSGILKGISFIQF